MRGLLLIFIVIASVRSKGQITFYNSYNCSGEFVHAIKTLDGGIIGLTYVFQTPNVKGAIVKTDGSGVTQWSLELYDTVSANTYYLQNVFQSQDSSYFISVMISMTSSITSSLIIHLDPFGNLLWKKLFSSVYIINYNATGPIISDGANGVIFVSQIGNNSIALTRCNSAGGIIWSKAYNAGNLGLAAPKMIQNSGGNYIIAGALTGQQTSVGGNLYLLKTDNFGDILYCKKYFPQPGGNLNSLLERPGGDLVFCGVTSYNCSNPVHSSYLMRTDSLGIPIWYKSYGCGTQIRQMHPSSGHWNLFGQLSTGPFVLCKADTNGVIQNTLRTGAANFSYTNGSFRSCEKFNNGFIACGNTFMVRMDSAMNGFCQDFPQTINTYVSTVQYAPIPVTTFNCNTTANNMSSLQLFTTNCMQIVSCNNLVTIDHANNPVQSATIYPNPVNDQLNVDNPSETSLWIEIYDVLGSKVFQGKESGKTITIELGHLPLGMYIFRSDKHLRPISFVKQ